MMSFIIGYIPAIPVVALIFMCVCVGMCMCIFCVVLVSVVAYYKL